jgi:hypothetical protein
MSRKDSYGYEPIQSNAYDSNIHFGMPLDDKALLKDYSTNVTTVLLIKNLLNSVWTTKDTIRLKVV